MGVPEQAQIMLSAAGFVSPATASYSVIDSDDVSIIEIADIAPPARNPQKINLHPERASDICRAFANGQALPPIDVTRSPGTDDYAYQLRDGYHRLNLSIAAGFTKIPAIIHDSWAIPIRDESYTCNLR